MMCEDTKEYNGHTYCGVLLDACVNGYEQGKADERTKHFDKIMSFINTSNRGNCDYFIVDQIEKYIAEQLKADK